MGRKRAGERMGSVSGSDFTLDRESGVPLSDQLVERLKAAIVKGRYQPGDVLPGILGLAATADVSEKVARMALRRLSGEGWIRTRRHVGSVVLARTGNVVRWRVLFFSHNPYFCFYTDRVISELRTRLLHEKGGVSTIAISRCRGKNSYLQLEELLKEKHFLQVSKSTLLNLMKVEAIKPSLNSRFLAELSSGEQIVISRKYVPNLKKALKGD